MRVQHELYLQHYTSESCRSEKSVTSFRYRNKVQDCQFEPELGFTNLLTTAAGAANAAIGPYGCRGYEGVEKQDGGCDYE